MVIYMDAENITVACKIDAPISKVWEFWTQPQHIINWNNVTDDWHTPKAENDLKVGGKFVYRMEAKDGSVAFDFEGVYDKIEFNELIEYTTVDGRKVKIIFNGENEGTSLTEIFQAEDIHPIEMQRDGWQAILNNFKRYTETS